MITYDVEWERAQRQSIMAYIQQQYVVPAALAFNENTHLYASGIMDSFSSETLKCWLERAYHIRIPDRVVLDEWSTVSRIVAAVKRLQRESAPPEPDLGGSMVP